MLAFDPDLWRARAVVKRMNGRNENKACARWIRDINDIESLGTIIEWCKKKSLRVVFTRKTLGFYDPENKEITISNVSSPRRQLHILLHECGHHLIFKSTLKFESSDMSENAIKRSLRHRVEVVDEEFEAWRRGWRLGVKIGILCPDNRREYERTRSIMLRSYMAWALQPMSIDEPAQPQVALETSK